MLSTLFHKYRIDYQTPTFLYYNRYILDGMIIRQHAITCPEHLLSSVGHVIKKGGGGISNYFRYVYPTKAARRAWSVITDGSPLSINSLWIRPLFVCKMFSCQCGCVVELDSRYQYLREKQGVYLKNYFTFLKSKHAINSWPWSCTSN